jgi:hypothetical protein
MNTKSINTPDQRNPFINKPDKETELWTNLREKQENEIVPIGYGFTPDELNHHEYNSITELPIGTRRVKKYMRIILPEKIWQPHIVLWVQAIETMYHLLYE